MAQQATQPTLKSLQFKYYPGTELHFHLRALEPSLDQGNQEPGPRESRTSSA